MDSQRSACICQEEEREELWGERQTAWQQWLWIRVPPCLEAGPVSTPYTGAIFGSGYIRGADHCDHCKCLNCSLKSGTDCLGPALSSVPSDNFFHLPKASVWHNDKPQWRPTAMCVCEHSRCDKGYRENVTLAIEISAANIHTADWLLSPDIKCCHSGVELVKGHENPILLEKQVQGCTSGPGSWTTQQHAEWLVLGISQKTKKEGRMTRSQCGFWSYS